MDFSHLPDDPFLKIFKYLSFDDCIRVGGVNKSFHRISQLVTSCTKSLDLDERHFPKLRADQLGVILDLCSTNLENISLYFVFDNDIRLAWKFASYHCPRLTNIYLIGCLQFDTATVGKAIFKGLVRNAPNVETLISDADYLVFPDVMIDNLKKLKLGVVNDATLQSMTGRCPNLKELKFPFCNVTAIVLDEFLASVPQINHIEFQHGTNIVLIDVINFWQLPLVSLRINNSYVIDAGERFMYKVASSFPQLKRFFMEKSMATNDGLAALSNLKELEIISVSFDAADDYGILQLTKCKKLRKLNMWWSKINGGTLIALLRGCPQLEHVGICAISEVDTPEEAVVVLESLFGIAKRDITIQIRLQYYFVGCEIKACPWKSKAVKEAIRKLDEMEGLKIKIGWFGGSICTGEDMEDGLDGGWAECMEKWMEELLDDE